MSKGYGESIDNTEIWDPTIKHLEKKFEDYFEWEMMVMSYKFMIHSFIFII